VVRANILLIKAASVIGANYGHFLATQTAQARVQVERMLGWIAAGRFSPHIHRRFAFLQCIAALETLAARQIVGKCVITTRAA
jgi:NADPH2:quinone reductase